MRGGCEGKKEKNKKKHKKTHKKNHKKNNRNKRNKRNKRNTRNRRNKRNKKKEGAAYIFSRSTTVNALVIGARAASMNGRFCGTASNANRIPSLTRFEAGFLSFSILCGGPGDGGHGGVR